MRVASLRERRERERESEREEGGREGIKKRRTREWANAKQKRKKGR